MQNQKPRAPLSTSRDRLGEFLDSPEERMELLVRIMDALPVSITYVNPRQCYVFCNKTCEKWFGRCLDDIRGRHVSDVLGPELYEEARFGVESALAGKAVSYERSVPFRDGAVQRIATSFIPHKDARGELRGFFTLEVDVTCLNECKQTEEKLQTSHQQLLDIIEFLPDATFVIDRERRVIAWNRAIETMTGVRKSEILGRGDFAYAVPFYGRPRPILIDLVMNDRIDLEECYDFIERKGNTVFGEVLVPNAYEGKGAYLWGTASPLFDVRGDIIGGIQSIRDITDRKRARDALLESERQLRNLSAQLLRAHEEERKRIARELHDSTGQSLAALKFYVDNALNMKERGKPEEMANCLDRMVPLIQNAIEEARRIYMGLRPSILDDLGIIATIQWYCREVQKTCPKTNILERIDVQEDKIPEDIKIVIFRLVQESLNNIIKYGKAERVTISLVSTSSTIELIVQDNGVGFDLDSYLRTENRNRGLGLAGMRERMELSGGMFSIQSVIGEGTTIRAAWPVSVRECDARPCRASSYEPP